MRRSRLFCVVQSWGRAVELPRAGPSRLCPWQVAGAYSKTWSCREDALLGLCRRLMEVPVGTPKEDVRSMLRASVFLVRRAMKDIVTSVSPLSLLARGDVPLHGRPEQLRGSLSFVIVTGSAGCLARCRAGEGWDSCRCFLALCLAQCRLPRSRQQVGAEA